MDRQPTNGKIQLEGIRVLGTIHKRRAALLGLDAPTKLDISNLYGRGTDEMSAERIERQAVLAALPLAEQARLYDVFEEANRVANAIPVTATLVDSGSDDDPNRDNRTDGGAESETSET